MITVGSDMAESVEKTFVQYRSVEGKKCCEEVSTPNSGSARLPRFNIKGKPQLAFVS